MAKANLPVNFKDDILKENMNGKRRFKMIQNTDGTVSFEDVTDYTQVVVYRAALALLQHYERLQRVLQLVHTQLISHIEYFP